VSIDVCVPGGDAQEPGFVVQSVGARLAIAAQRAGRDTTLYGVTNDQNGLLVNAYPTTDPGDGFTIYTFRSNGTFSVWSGWQVTADVLLVGAGGSGGGGYQGGGGGGGGVIDEHDFVIDGDTQESWDVIVGLGGAAPPYRHPHGHNGGDSSYGGMIAYGGGYGSSEFAPLDAAPYIYYHASDGASGGGGGPWNPPPDPHTIDGDSGPGGQAIHGDQGFPGEAGRGTASYGGWHTACGGGGAREAGNTRGQPNGGHGRWCDIAGWGAAWDDPELADFEIRMVQWYGGGGAGKERPNNWGYLDGVGGFGGGGQPGADGISYLGGGGGGNGNQRPGHVGDADGTSGGKGVAIIRIRSIDEHLVRSSGAFSITRIGADQLHLDTRGDEGGPL